MKNKKLIIVFLLILVIATIFFLFYYKNKNINNNKFEISSLKNKQPEEIKTKTLSLITLDRKSTVSDPDYNFTSYNIGIGDDSNNIYLNFDKEIQGNESLDNFRKYLKSKETVINISLPELQTYYKNLIETNEIPRITDFDPFVRDNINIELASYEKGKLKGVLKTKTKEASYWVRDSEDKECKTGDMMGICVKSIPFETNLIVNFEVQVK